MAQAPAAPAPSAVEAPKTPPIEARFEGEGIWTVKEGGRDLCTLPCTTAVTPGAPIELHPVKVSGSVGQRGFLPVALDAKDGPRQVVNVTRPRDWSFTGVGIGTSVLGATFLAVGAIPFHRSDGTTAPPAFRVASSIGGGLVLLGGILILTVLNPHYYSTDVKPASAPPRAAVAPRLSFGPDHIGIAF